MKERTEREAQPPQVLLVGGGPEAQRLGSDLAEAFAVATIAQLDETKERAAVDQPDVIVLLDERDVDPVPTMQQLAADEQTQLIPVLVVSADAPLDTRIRMLDGGAHDFLSVSDPARELVARVAAAARIHRRVKALQDLAEAHRARPAGRAQFEQRLRQEVARSARSSSPLSVMIVDVDHMSVINRTQGTKAGDELLHELGSLLRSILRLSDVTFHHGRDEFAVILPDTDGGTAYLVAERCRHTLRALEAGGRPVTASVGVAEYSPGNTTEEIIEKAQRALSAAKQSGGNRSWRANDPRRAAPTAKMLSQQLTEREWAVLTQLTHRRTEQDIGKSLGISAGTVRSHKARIRRKLHVPPNQRLSEFARLHFRYLLPQDGRS